MTAVEAVRVPERCACLKRNKRVTDWTEYGAPVISHLPHDGECNSPPPLAAEAKCEKCGQPDADCDGYSCTRQAAEDAATLGAALRSSPPSASAEVVEVPRALLAELISGSETAHHAMCGDPENCGCDEKHDAARALLGKA